MHSNSALVFFFVLTGSVLVTTSTHAAEEKQQPTTIGIPAESNKTLDFAAQELSKYFEAMTGRDYPVADEEKEGNAPLVRLKVDASLSHDGYRIDRDAQTICISGGSPRGCLYGAYAFLNELGCRWPLPGKEYEVVPKLKRISWSKTKIKSEPAIAGRGMILFYSNDDRDKVLELVDWSAKNRLNFVFLCSSKIHSHRLPEFKEAFAVRDMGLEWGMHLLAKYLPRDLFKEHPEYFRMENGKRTEKLNMCPSSPEAADIIAKNFIKDCWDKLCGFERLEVLHLWPDDLLKGGWCSCDKCKGLTASDQALKIINEVAKRLPLGNTSLAHLSYHTTISAPTNIKPEKNVRLLYAPRERCYKHPMGECPINRTYLENLKSQIPLFSNEPEIFEYYQDLILFRGLPMPLYRVIGKDIKAYREAGVTRISSLSFGDFSEWAYGPSYYLFGKCLWRGKGDPRDIEEYYDAVYGPQAKVMQQYFHLLSELCETVMQLCDYNMDADMRYPRYWEPYTKKHVSLLAPLVTDEHLDKIEGTLKDAIAAAAEPYRTRIEYQLILWQFTRLEVPAIYRTMLAGHLNANLGQDATDAERLHIIALFKEALREMEKATQILASAPKELQHSHFKKPRNSYAVLCLVNAIKKIEKKLKVKPPSTQPTTQP